VDDEPPIRRSLAGILSDEGYEISLTGSGEEALNSLDGEMPDVMLLDVWLPGMDGLEVLERARQKNSQLPVIMISGHANVENAVKAVRMGAYDFIEKPLDMDKTLLSLRNAVKMLRLTRENQMLRGGIPQLVGQSPAMIALREAISAVAPSNSWVLITGENGTGKELVANAIHRLSVRAEGPLVEVNCAAIPEDLIESELFGHEKGAFTGAGSRRQGRFDLANGGTLFLDEIADMSLKTQAKILRILQEQRFERVGGSQTIQVNVRVIAATNKDLNAEMAAGRFREDLYYRLNVVPIHIPPLRQRQEDIPLLTRDFLHQPHLSPAKRVSPEAMRVLSEYHWPGNVRELKNMIERLVIMTQGQEIGLSHLPEPLHQPEKDKESTELAVLLDKDYRSARAGFEKLYLQNKLRRHQGNMSQMAREVGLERSHLYKKFKILGLITDPEG
jgi:two-component system nitrogen regulation response regulator NtrX